MAGKKKQDKSLKDLENTLQQLTIQARQVQSQADSLAANVQSLKVDKSASQHHAASSSKTTSNLATATTKKQPQQPSNGKPKPKANTSNDKTALSTAKKQPHQPSTDKAKQGAITNHKNKPPKPPNNLNVTTRSMTEAVSSNSKTKMGDPKLFLLPRPFPTAAYLARAVQPPQPVEPKRLLIILDLNGTLVHRTARKANSPFTKRPFCNEFIRYVMSEHHVMIWSSAREHNVERLCDSIFDEVGISPPIHRWHRGHFDLSPAFFDLNIQLYKQLTWVWDAWSISNSYRQVFDQSNTVLIDDSTEKAVSEPYNLVLVNEYDGTDQKSDVLGRVVEYLDEARRTHDVSSFIHSKPFSFRTTDAPYVWSKEVPVLDEDDGGVPL